MLQHIKAEFLFRSTAQLIYSVLLCEARLPKVPPSAVGHIQAAQVLLLSADSTVLLPKLRQLPMCCMALSTPVLPGLGAQCPQIQ